MFLYRKPYRSLWVAVVLMGWFSTAASGQATQPPQISQFDRRVISPAPQAMQLGVYGNVTPDLSTGAMQLSVPVTEATSRVLRLPITLNYHYTGLMVEELSSWVGLGWTLSAGGVITRTIRGLPDELASPQGYSAFGQARIQSLFPQGAAPIREVGFNPAYRNAQNGDLWDLCHNSGNTQVDTEPDAYTINMPGYNGKFLLDATTQPLLSPHTDVRLVGDHTQWLATAGDGTRYYFGAAESTQGSDDLGALPNGSFNTAWYLSDIVSPDGADTIHFEYRANPRTTPIPTNVIVKEVYNISGPYTDCMPSTTRSYKQTSNVRSGSWPVVRNSVQTIYLAQITTATLSIDFLSDTLRNDIAINDGSIGRRLTAVTVRERYSGRLLKRIELTQGYFSNNNAGSDPTIRRLRLDAVTEVGKPSHHFYYDESQQMPSRKFSFSKDHWGFYNGRIANTLIPALPPSKSIYKGSGLTGANREADGSASKIGALLRVRYPTGGSTSFEYEPNAVLESCGKPAVAYGRGTGTSATIFSIGARASGGFSMPMNNLEQSIAAMYPSPGPGSGGQNRSGTPTNVQTAIFEAPNGGYIQSLTGAIIGCFKSNTQTIYGQIPMDLYLYKVDTASYLLDTYDSLTPLCHDNTLNQCGTTLLHPIGGNINRQLAPGTYCLAAICNPNNSGMSAAISIDVDIYPSDTSTSCYQSRQVGGLRIAKTRDLTGQGDSLITTYTYSAKGSNGSSGVLYFEPTYAYTDACQNLVVGASDQGKTAWLESGYHLGYGRVTVRKSGGQAGTTVYTYNTSELITPSFVVPASLRGLVLKSEQFNDIGQLVKRDSTVYVAQQTGSIRAIRIYPSYTRHPGSSIGDLQEYFTVKEDFESTYWPRVIKTIETIIGTAGLAASTHTNSTTNHYLPWSLPEGFIHTTQPILITRSTSSGSEIITKTLYAGQYTQMGTDDASLGIQALLNNGMISTPIEQQTWSRSGADSVLIGGKLTSYSQRNNGVYPLRISQLATTRPLAANNFVSSAIWGGMFQKDQHYQERHTFTHYDAFGNLLQQQAASGKSTGYVWGYSASLPIAETVGAAYNAVAYTSFEPDATGRWTYDSTGTHRVLGGRTGRWAYRLNGGLGVSRRVLVGDYDLQVWATAEPLLYANSGFADQQGYVRSKAVVATAPGGWKQYQWILHLPVAATLKLNTLELNNGTSSPTILLDEVRLYPSGAQMTSYTYDVAVGMTSQTDPSGRTIIYEYDTLGRLLRTRDEKGRILSQQQYHYARP